MSCQHLPLLRCDDDNTCTDSLLCVTTVTGLSYRSLGGYKSAAFGLLPEALDKNKFAEYINSVIDPTLMAMIKENLGVM